MEDLGHSHCTSGVLQRIHPQFEMASTYYMASEHAVDRILCARSCAVNETIDRWTTLFNCVRTLKELQVLEVVHGSIISQETQLEAIPIPRLPVWGH